MAASISVEREELAEEAVVAVRAGGELDGSAKPAAEDEDDDVVLWPSLPEYVRAAVKKHKMILESAQFLQCKAAKPCTCLLMGSPSCEPMAIRHDLFTY